jgi:hypothetical protein
VANVERQFCDDPKTQNRTEPHYMMALGQDNGLWIPRSIVRVEVMENLIMRGVDYSHCPWVLAAANSVVVEPS